MRKLLTILAFLPLFIACGPGNGPEARLYPPERSTDEIVHGVLDAIDNDSFYYMGQQELYYLEDGGWQYYGTKPRFSTPGVSDKIEGHELPWICFNTSDFEPLRAHRTSDYSYNYVVTYYGVDYYF